MASLGIVVLPLLLYAATLVDARSQYHLEETADRSGGEWSKRRLHGEEDYYGFLTGEQKRAGHHPVEDYMEFLVGDKRKQETKHNKANWDSIGANAKRTNTRKKRSIDGIRQKTNPAKTGGSRGQSSQRRLDPRSAPDGVESWEDFVLGKRTSGRNEDLGFDDSLVGDKRGISDYDYAEFVLGKRP